MSIRSCAAAACLIWSESTRSIFPGIDLCFCALPHKTSQEVIAALPRDLKIVDLSRRFPAARPAAYEKWYGNPHARRRASEGRRLRPDRILPRRDPRGARLVAWTGCNAATGQFALLPLIARA
jgi:N-acetyl-gamma-glutamyl-phosphate reductase